FLKAHGEKLGFDVEVINAISVDDTIVSSTKIREAILAGDVKYAAALLGRPYNLKGAVVKGYGRGEGLGFPTANVTPGKVLIPASGVYVALVDLAGQKYGAVLNIGSNPTFGNDAISVEVHLLDFQGTIYGEDLEILFVERIRGEVKFASPDELAAQIKRDIDLAKHLLAVSP
ncbi:MAG: riboflavin kinase, partial [Smithellaceae bacterium]|nr:riboflavin kinase [Smithellaceae bacterium]